MSNKITAVIIFLVIGLILWILGRYDLNLVLDEILTLEQSALFLALGFTALNYLILTFYDALAFKYIKEDLSFKRIGLTAFLSYSFSHNVGAALVSGGAVRYRMYSRWGISGANIARIVVFTGFHYWVGLFVLGAVVGIIFPSDFAEIYPIGKATIISLAALCLLPIAYYFYLTLQPGKKISIKNFHMEVPPLKLAALALLVACLDWLCAATVLFFLLPGYHDLSFLEGVIAYLGAQMAAVSSHVPGGIGVFESVLFLFLQSHYRAEALLGSLLLFRFCYYFLPFFLAAVLYILYELKLHKVLFKRIKDKIEG